MLNKVCPSIVCNCECKHGWVVGKYLPILSIVGCARPTYGGGNTLRPPVYTHPVCVPIRGCVCVCPSVGVCVPIRGCGCVPIRGWVCTHPWVCVYPSVGVCVSIRGWVCTHPWVGVYPSVGGCVPIRGWVCTHPWVGVYHMGANFTGLYFVNFTNEPVFGKIQSPIFG